MKNPQAGAEEVRNTKIVEVARDISAGMLEDFIRFYEETFPIEDEREPAGEWIHRITERPAAPQPLTHLLLAHDEDTGELAGGVIVEFYRRSCCALVTYLLVKSAYRRQGLARRLLNAARTAVLADAKIEDSQLKAIFAEVENPACFSSDSGILSPGKRLDAFAKLGAQWLRFAYMQPALDSTTKPVSHLLLICLPLAPEESLPRRIENEDLLAFLREFYQALGIADPSANEAFTQMQRSLTRPLPIPACALNSMIPKEPAEEKPALRLTEGSVCLHLIEKQINPVRLQSSDVYHYCADTGSMELDLLAHVFRQPPVCNSELVTYDPLPVRIDFPPIYVYQTEGRIEERKSSRTCVSTLLSISKTYFRDSGITVWHAAFTPENDYFSEFDIIKLIHLYDGKSENTSLGDKIGFRLESGPACTLPELVFNISGAGGGEKDRDESPLAPTTWSARTNLEVKGGTVQIQTGAPEGRDSKANILHMISRIRKEGNEDAHERISASRSRLAGGNDVLKGHCGIITGIFDFAEIDDEEMWDTLEPTFSDGRSYIRLHRATLLSISDRDRALAASPRLGASPYLFLPHAVLIHNEKVLQEAGRRVQGGMENLIRVKGTLFSGLRAKVNDVEQAINGAEHWLGFYLPNIFNYGTEKELFEKGATHRALPQLHEMTKTRLQELKQRANAIWNLRRDLGQMLITILLGVIPAVELTQNAPRAIALPVIGLLVVLMGIFWLIGIRARDRQNEE